ncbi:MAG: aminomethyl-transferring glycine dehydrogenase subunit GcvPB [Limnochordaceae bacterium]|nr:aminomethyl-transferring glycine dehydrogenase subunit GcvPB [Limnochordaceae bacterium]
MSSTNQGADGAYPLLFERSVPGRRGVLPPATTVPVAWNPERLPASLRRARAPLLPELSELDVVRHYSGLSQRNWGVDLGFYPLGSCTMKYNPKVNEAIAALPGWQRLHPYQPEQTVQGALQILFELERDLCALTGMAQATLQPSAGAQAELLGLLLIRAHHQHHDPAHAARRRQIIVPDSAHGTNPASAAAAGYEVVQVRSNDRGLVDVKHLKELVGPQTAGLMLTNPNTLGLFEEDIETIAEIIHAAGGLLYYDGANLNAIVGIVRPADMGFDIVHLNLHKTFSTPHGGGGPGAGVIAVTPPLAPFLPGPRVEYDAAKNQYHWRAAGPWTVGRLREFYGNFGVLLRAWAYIRSLGAEGLREVARTAVLNANYCRAKLQDCLEVPYADRPCKHEFVASAREVHRRTGLHAQDLAKGLLDRGFHAPTVAFPLIVEEALMCEPTETESLQTLDAFVDALQQVVHLAYTQPDELRTAPHRAPVGRLDEVLANRHLKLRWLPDPPATGPTAEGPTP